MKIFKPEEWHEHFPALNNTGVYLDNAATTLKHKSVTEATHHYYGASAGSVHRSQFNDARQLTEQYEYIRSMVAAFIHAPAPGNIIWTRGATESINLVAQSYLRPRLQPGDEIVVSEAEHHANLVPWLIVAEQTGAKVIKWPLNHQRLPDLTLLPHLITQKTRLLALSQMSNVTGGCPDITTAIQIAHDAGAKVMIDGAQGIAHIPTSVQALDIDFYAFSAHKLYGPTGLGVLYGKTELLAEMPPWQGGGKMLLDVNFEGFTPQPPPWCFEAGTPNIAGVIGFGAVIEWLNSIDLVAAEQWSCHLADIAEYQLSKISGFRSFRASHSATLAFDIQGQHHHDIMTLLAEQGVAMRSGQHCAQPLMAALGVTGTLRASFAPYNTLQDVEALLRAMHTACALLADN